MPECKLKVRAYFYSNLTKRMIDDTRMCEVLKDIT